MAFIGPNVKADRNLTLIPFLSLPCTQGNQYFVGFYTRFDSEWTISPLTTISAIQIKDYDIRADVVETKRFYAGIMLGAIQPRPANHVLIRKTKCAN